jgi:predicted SprT family Zn-dependent metalloprotease
MWVQVCDTEERMRETLVHEMCHAATHLIDREDKAGHGKLFKAWGRQATRRFPDIGVVDTCHSYEIHAAHKFQCERDSCGVVYSRHSKKGLDTDRYAALSLSVKEEAHNQEYSVTEIGSAAACVAVS